jgi:ppGpp synthetase/RelA/SpoT-type nucleotidyltranferase
LEISKSAVDRAGDELRVWWQKADAEQPVPASARLLFAFRDEFPNPTKKVTLGLRGFVKRESEPDAQLFVGQRLKRAPQIVSKLARHPKMKLSRMQDIGGCRAILLDHDQVQRVAARIENNWTIKHRKHYTREEPAESGYRALHIVVEKDGRLVEIQLRTANQHRWAEEIERADRRLRFDMKSGEGPADLLKYFRMAADGLAIEDAGETPDAALLRDFSAVREGIRHYFERS